MKKVLLVATLVASIACVYAIGLWKAPVVAGEFTKPEDTRCVAYDILRQEEDGPYTSRGVRLIYKDNTTWTCVVDRTGPEQIQVVELRHVPKLAMVSTADLEKHFLGATWVYGGMYRIYVEADPDPEEAIKYIPPTGRLIN